LIHFLKEKINLWLRECRKKRKRPIGF